MLNNEYYSQVFHEMKNSVTLINSYLQLIEKKYPAVADLDYWSTSKTETARLRAITTELSQVKLGSQLVLETLDLRNFISDCCYDFCCSGDEEGITYSLTLPDQPLLVSIDAKQLRHAMVNLLKNSCEAMSNKGTIAIEAFADRGLLTVRIKDSGCGIPSDMIGHIFDPFVTTKEEGSGLGLNITRQVLLAHKGTISVESTLGEGSTFTLTLPQVIIS